jgi:radical SAM superfamily enzyme with C-terminal helix-hairpin-helix motif
MSHFTILDAYLDEPASFGVPPFVSPSVRYTYGALLQGGISPENIDYITIEELRTQDFILKESHTTLFILGGSAVPGRYLGHKIGTKKEVEDIITKNVQGKIYISGPVASVLTNLPGHAVMIKNDVEKFAHGLVIGDPRDSFRTPSELKSWAILGSDMVSQHLHFPRLIMEIETYRGCPRQVHCSFCSEGLRRNIEFRPVQDIIEEIESLIAKGITRFRLGNQPDILQYMTPFKDFINGFPRPDTGPVLELFNELGSKRKAGEISILNIDNANPGTVASFPEESRKIISAIASAVSPGDTIPLGIESFDPALLQLNNLKVTPKEAFKVIELINEEGSYIEKGLPKFLPGINLIHGLRGETDKTFELNFKELERIHNAGLLLRRINIRQLLPYPGTPLAEEKVHIPHKTRNRFLYFRDKIREMVDIPMMKKIFTPGLILEDVFPVVNQESYSYARQIASYAITLKVPMVLELNTSIKAYIVDHRERSIVALPVGENINTLPREALGAVPGIGKKGASDLVLKRPFQRKVEVPWEILGRVAEPVRENLLNGLE